MQYEEILKMLAPCGLNCSKCLAFADGEIKQHSCALNTLLGSFERYAQRFSAFNPMFENYPQFKELLEFFTQGTCTGCRNGMCMNAACKVMSCYRTQGVDFCFQCANFPCDKMDADPDLKRRWIEMNSRMKVIGVEAYYEETKDQPRYR